MHGRAAVGVLGIQRARWRTMRGRCSPPGTSGPRDGDVRRSRLVRVPDWFHLLTKNMSEKQKRKMIATAKECALEYYSTFANGSLEREPDPVQKHTHQTEERELLDVVLGRMLRIDDSGNIYSTSESR